MWIELFDEVAEPPVRVIEIFAWFDLRYQTHHGAIGTVPEERISEVRAYGNTPLRMIIIGDNATALLEPVVSQELILACFYLSSIYP